MACASNAVHAEPRLDARSLSVYYDDVLPIMKDTRLTLVQAPVERV